MRLARAAVVLGLVVAVARAQTESTTTTTLPPTQPEFATTVKGTVPDLTGRWVAVCWIEIPGGRTRTTATLVEIERRDGQPQLRQPFLHLPDKLEQAMEDADEEKHWEPTPDDLKDIARAWDAGTLETIHPPARLDSYFTGRDAFDATFTSEPRTKDAQWVLQQTETFDPSAAPAVRQVNIYATLGERDGHWQGNYTTTLLAAAPFPIPITLQGTFGMFKLEPPSRGVLTRLADLFRGCGR